MIINEASLCDSHRHPTPSDESVVSQTRGHHSHTSDFQNFFDFLKDTPERILKKPVL